MGIVSTITNVRVLVLEECAKLAEEAESDRSRADAPYDSGAGSCGYALACSDIAAAIRAKIEPLVLMPALEARNKAQGE